MTLALTVLFAVNLYVALGTAATWLIIVFFFRISSLAALVSALFAPFFTLILYNAGHPYFASLLVIAVLLVWRQSELQKQAFDRGLQQTAAALSVAVDRKLESHRVMLETLAESAALYAGDIEGFHAFAARAADRHGALFVSFFDRDGRQVFNTMRRPGEALPTPFRDDRVQLDDANRPPVGDPTFLRLAFETGKPTYSDLTYGLVAGRLIFVVNVPIVRDGRVQYVINAAFEARGSAACRP